MAFSSGRGSNLQCNINVTPLVDVVLVLLIIFMVITPMLQQGKDVHLPKATKSSDENKRAEPFVVALTAAAELFVEGQPIEKPALRARIERELARDPNRQILLKGDERLTVKQVRLALAEMREGGAKGIALGVEEEKGGQ